MVCGGRNEEVPSQRGGVVSVCQQECVGVEGRMMGVFALAYLLGLLCLE